MDRGKEVQAKPPYTYKIEPKLTTFLLPPSIALGGVEETRNNGSLDNGKALFDHQAASKVEPKPETSRKRAEPEPSSNIHMQPDMPRGGSSKSFLVPRKPIICKFCGQKFSTTQAFGGHQNAHKQERELQKAMKAACELGGSPFPYNIPGTTAPAYQGSYYGYQFQYPSYLRNAHRGWQPRPTYPHSTTSLGWVNPTGFGVGRPALGGFVGPSATKPVGTLFQSGWSRPYVHASGPTRTFANFGSTDASNVTTFLQGMEDQAGSAKKQRTESPGLCLSLKCSDSDLPSKLDGSAELPTEHNESTELDLTLKL